MEPHQIWIIDPNPIHRNLIRLRLERAGLGEVITIPGPEDCLYRLGKGMKPRFLVADVASFNNGYGNLPQIIRNYAPLAKLIIFSDEDDAEKADQLLSQGADDYILKAGADLNGLQELCHNLRYLSALEVSEHF